MGLGPLPNAQNVVRVRLNGSYQGQPWVALHFWHYNATVVNTGDINSLLTQWNTIYTTNLAPAMSSTVVLNTIDGWDLSSPAGATASVNSGVQGSRIGTALPVQVAAVCSWKVNFRWRGGHARTYWPAGVQSDISNGHLWTTAAHTAFENANSAYLSQINAITIGGVGGHLTLVRYIHTIHNPDGTKTVAYFTPPLDLQIVDATVDQRIDTQRRRLGPDL